VATYEFDSKSSVTTISQNIGLASLSDLTIKVKTSNVTNKTATLTFSNQNSAAVNVSYDLNNDIAGAFTVKAKGLLSKETVYDLPLSGLNASGENQLKVNWTAGVYHGNAVLFNF